MHDIFHAAHAGNPPSLQVIFLRTANLRHDSEARSEIVGFADRLRNLGRECGGTVATDVSDRVQDQSTATRFDKTRRAEHATKR